MKVIAKCSIIGPEDDLCIKRYGDMYCGHEVPHEKNGFCEHNNRFVPQECCKCISIEEAESMDKENGLMYNPGGHPFSRDWERIPCTRSSCNNNTYGTECGVPSMCKIGDDGKCIGFSLRPDMGKSVEEK